MEINDVMNLNNMIYRIYDAQDAGTLKKNVLTDIRILIRCSYASILMANPDEKGPPLIDPVCSPEEFLPAEEKYVPMQESDHLLWTIHSDHQIVTLESNIVSDEKRLSSRIYSECYSDYDIYDSLQLNLFYEKEFLGVLTLYHTTPEGKFVEENAVYMRLLGRHLGKQLYLLTNPLEKTGSDKPYLDNLREEYGLTKREYEILSLIFDNISDDEIADRIHISPHTLKKHIQNTYRKLDISARWELLKFKP